MNKGEDGSKQSLGGIIDSSKKIPGVIKQQVQYGNLSICKKSGSILVEHFQERAYPKL